MIDLDKLFSQPQITPIAHDPKSQGYAGYVFNLRKFESFIPADEWPEILPLVLATSEPYECSITGAILLDVMPLQGPPELAAKGDQFLGEEDGIFADLFFLATWAKTTLTLPFLGQCVGQLGIDSISDAQSGQSEHLSQVEIDSTVSEIRQELLESLAYLSRARQILEDQTRKLIQNFKQPDAQSLISWYKEQEANAGIYALAADGESAVIDYEIARQRLSPELFQILVWISQVQTGHNPT